jgi:uncharacterized circularly permuted ATP-grasp superfamily protein
VIAIPAGNLPADAGSLGSPLASVLFPLALNQTILNYSDYALDASYDEMFESAGQPRPHCRALYDELRTASESELSLRQLEADKAFLTQGITFTVYGDDQGTERIFPFDASPATAPKSTMRLTRATSRIRSNPRPA